MALAGEALSQLNNPRRADAPLVSFLFLLPSGLFALTYTRLL